MSERVARNSRMSAYILQSLLPYFLSTSFLTCSRRTFRTSQMATNWTSFSGSIQPRSNSPRAPIPMAPSTIRSLGATAPPRPSADAGTMVGASTAAPAAAAVCRHSLRVIRVVDVVFLVDLVPLIASPPLRIPGVSHNDLLAKDPPRGPRTCDPIWSFSPTAPGAQRPSVSTRTDADNLVVLGSSWIGTESARPDSQA